MHKLGTARLLGFLCALALCALPAGCAREGGAPARELAKSDAVKVGQRVRRIPVWAKKELTAFKATEKTMRDFMKRFVKPDGCTVVTHRASAGGIDDILEGFFKWDKYVLLAGSDELREQYVNVWKYTWNYGVKKGIFKDGFYVKGYNAEHAGELFPLLWACLELAPEDKDLIATNRACADVFLRPEWFHPKNHLFRYCWIRSRPIDEPWRKKWLEPRKGECAVNPLYAAGVWLAYLSTGEEKYRKWVLDYSAAWNRLAKMNKGVFPYHVDTESFKLGPGGDGRWWKGNRGSASFDFEKYGMVVASRGWRNLPAAAVLLDGGKPEQAAGLVSTVKAIFKNSVKGLPAAGYAPEKGGWYRDEKTWSHHVPTLLDKAYALTWDPELLKLIKGYPVKKVSWLEKEIATWCQFTYAGMGDLSVVEKGFDRAVRRAERRRQKARALKNPRKGDHLTEVTIERLGDFDYVDGASWTGHNARNGGPSLGPVGYFSASGRRGLPPGLAALVRHTDEGSAKLLLCNTTRRPVRLLLTGGYYGQHRIDSLASAGRTRAVGARRVLLEFAPKSLAEVTLKFTRSAFKPTLTPQKD